MILRTLSLGLVVATTCGGCASNGSDADSSPSGQDEGGALIGSAGGEAGATAETGGASEAGADSGSTDPLPLKGQPCAGYTLIGSPENDAGDDYTASLIDMDGQVVHRWTITGFPPKMMPGGSLIGCGGVFPGSYDCVEMQQVSWQGDVQWSFSNWAEEGGITGARQHHDFQRQGNPLGSYAPGQDFVENGTTLVLAHAQRVVPEIRDGALEDDVIYEIDWDGAMTGFIWYGSDHFEEFGFDEAARADLRTRDPDASYLEWLHGNSASLLGPNHWFDEGHAEFHPDNIMYSSRAASFVIIISRETGAVVWRIGPDFAGHPEEQLGQFAGQHHPHLIPRGLPGAGNVLVFDNGGSSGYGGMSTTGFANRYSRDYSRVLEFDPVNLQIVWEYGPASGDESFFSYLISSAQRLPNGNTLITIGMAGRVIEVTEDGQIVWEYQYEPTSSGPNAAWVYRAYRVPPEWLPAGENEALGGYATWASLFEQN